MVSKVWWTCLMTVLIVLSLLIASSEANFDSSATLNANDKRYLASFEKFRNLMEQKNTQTLKQACNSSEPALQIICGLLIYLSEDKKNPHLFIAKVPQTESETKWIWYWDVILLRNPDDKTLALFPSGFASKYIDEIASLIELMPDEALQRLLILLTHADGLYAEYLDYKLITIFKNNPVIIYNHWHKIRRYIKSLQRVIDYAVDEEIFLIKKKIDYFCSNKPHTQRCREIQSLLAGQKTQK